MTEDLGRPRPKTRDPITSCFVPNCNSKVLISPEKHFFRVPDRNKVEWCLAVGKQNVPKGKGALYICEDHISVEEDLLNYNEWKSNNVYGKLKTEVLNLRNITSSHFREPTTSTSFSLQQSVSQVNKDKGIMCKPETKHRGVQMKTVTADRCTGTTLMKKNKPIEKKTFQEFHAEDCSEAPSAAGTTTEYSETESSVNVIKDLSGRQFILN